MAKDNRVHQRLSGLWQDRSVEVLNTNDEKYAILSDFHLGNKTNADDFEHNESVALNALDYYRRNGYTLILLGDFEELWQFDLKDIKEHYSKIYEAIQAFGDKRVYRVWGNHDLDWSENWNNDPIRNDPAGVRRPEEALKMNDKNGKTKIFLVHGHQGSSDADKFSWLSRGVVWLYGKTIERVIDLDRAPSATKSMVIKDFEKERYAWAKENKVIIICGHSHRAIFRSRTWIDKIQEEIEALQRQILSDISKAEKKKIVKKIYDLGREHQHEQQLGRDIDPVDDAPKPCYFNSGCGLYTDGITALEIIDDEISLKKWDSNSNGGPSADYGSGKLSEFIAETEEG